MTAKSSNDLPEDVKRAIHIGRKIEAIKLLRQHRKMGLKEAKETMEAYVQAFPHRIGAPGTGSGAGIERRTDVHPLRKLYGILMLCLLGFSVFLVIFLPFEIYKTFDAHHWEPVEVRITTSRIEAVSNEYYFDIAVEEIATQKRSSRVQVRYGDINLSLVVFGDLFKSSLYRDQEVYPVGAVVTAYRSPDGNSYVLEQNAPDFMLMLFAIACIYPGIAVWRLVKTRREVG